VERKLLGLTRLSLRYRMEKLQLFEHRVQYQIVAEKPVNRGWVLLGGRKLCTQLAFLELLDSVVALTPVSSELLALRWTLEHT
jgi:hypothetical protein